MAWCLIKYRENFTFYECLVSKYIHIVAINLKNILFVECKEQLAVDDNKICHCLKREYIVCDKGM